MIILNDSFRRVNAKGGRVGGKHPLYPDAGRVVKPDDFDSRFNFTSLTTDPIVGFGVIRDVVDDTGDGQFGEWGNLTYDWESGINKWEIKRINVTIEVESETQFIRQPNILFDIEIDAQGYREIIRTGSSIAELLASNVDLIPALENWNTTTENWESLNQLIIWSDAMYPPRTITDTASSLFGIRSGSSWFKDLLIKRTANLLLELQSSCSFQLNVFGDWNTSVNNWQNLYTVWPTFPPQTITDTASSSFGIRSESSWFKDTLIRRTANLLLDLQSSSSFQLSVFGDWDTTVNKWENLYTVWPAFPPQTITDSANASLKLRANSTSYIDTIISRTATISFDISASSSFSVSTIFTRSSSATLKITLSVSGQLISFGDWQTAGINWESTNTLWDTASTGQTITSTASSLIGISSNSSFLIDKLIKRTANVAFDINASSSGSASTIVWETTSTQWQSQTLLWETASTGYTITDTASVSMSLNSGNILSDFTYGWNTDTTGWENQSDTWPIVWTPTEITTEGWWDASDNTSYVVSGTEVTSVTDKSGNSYTLQKGTTGPTIGTRTLNGLSVFEFTGANGNVLENNSFAWNQASNALGFAIVYRLDDDGLTDQDFLMSGTNSSTRIGIRRLTGNSWQILASGGTITTSSTLGAEPVTQMMVARFNSTNSYIRIDGSQETSGTIGTVAFSALNINGNYINQQGVEGFIAEMIFFSDLTKTEIIEGYLAHKWGLVGNLPSNHLYKVSAP